MKIEIRNAIKDRIQTLLGVKRPGFLTIPQAMMQSYIDKKSEVMADLESGVKTRKEVYHEFEPFFIGLMEEAKDLEYVINLRDPETDEILVEDCTLADLKFFLETDALDKIPL